MPDKTYTPQFRIEVSDLGHEVTISIGNTPIVTYGQWGRNPEDDAEGMIADVLRPLLEAEMHARGLKPPQDYNE